MQRPHHTALALCSAFLCLPSLATAQTTRVSTSSAGVEGNLESGRPSISHDGRRVVFVSNASNLVPGDVNGQPDVFVHDRDTGTTVMVSVTPLGTPGNGASSTAMLSGNGQVVTFWSEADDLVPADTNGNGDIFVRDLVSGVTERANVSSSGIQALPSFGRGSALSFDGRFTAFVSSASNLVPGDTNGISDVFVRDRLLGTTSLVSVDDAGQVADLNSGGPSISADGRWVSFASQATNLVGGDTNLFRDVFLHDRATTTTRRISLDPLGSEGSSHSGFNHLTGYYFTHISPDGRYVVFPSYADNLVAGDTNDVPDVFIYDAVLDSLERVSVDSSGTESNGFSYFPTVFGAGRYVAYFSFGDNLVAGDSNGVGDAFLRDRLKGVTTRISIEASGGQANGASDYPVGSEDATAIVFDSVASNLVAGDGNAMLDIFVRDFEPDCAEASVYCTAKLNSQGCLPTISTLGVPSASNLQPFWIRADGLINNMSGQMIYGSGANATPFQGGFMCVSGVKRTSFQLTGGNPPPQDCSGSMQFDFNQHVQTGNDASLVPGALVHAQYWSRDVNSPSFPTNLSDAVVFELCP